MLTDTWNKYNLPSIPDCKKYYSDYSNPENDVILKCSNKEVLTADDEAVLNEAVEFYQIAFPALQAITLADITLEESEHLISYLNVIFTIAFPIGNDLLIEKVFRVSNIEDSFIEKGKVRNPKFLTYPPLDCVKKSKRYNRANSFSKTVFYASFKENVAIRETRPQKGKKIIISTWQPTSNDFFNSYPITNSEVNNQQVQKSTTAFKKTISAYHPLLAKIMDLNIGFLASEFVKDCQIKNDNRLEYLYSAYFADKTLVEYPKNLNMQNFDLIIYPSVAYKHLEENIAMFPSSVETKMKIIYAAEYEVEETFYDTDLEINSPPAKLKFIREATWFDKDQIIWEDD